MSLRMRNAHKYRLLKPILLMNSSLILLEYNVKNNKYVTNVTFLLASRCSPHIARLAEGTWETSVRDTVHIKLFITHHLLYCTLYPAHSRVGRGNLVFRHSVLHLLPNSGDIAC